MGDSPDSPAPAVETAFTPPSIHPDALLSGATYSHYSPVPPALLPTSTTPAPECVLGVDEAGRGPVLGPMVYGVFYLPTPLSDPLLRETHHFDDSKVLNADVRTSLMQTLCDPSSDLYASCGWAIDSLSARDIAADMLGPTPRNLNTQALESTVGLIRGVLERGVNVQEIFVDTVGNPASYQAKISRFFPGIKITVAKKADSLYPSVSAASVCAKVTRDMALSALYAHHITLSSPPDSPPASQTEMAWGSGYPSDGRCVTWLRGNMHPVFGWGPECRHSWGTAKDLLEGKGAVRVEWPVEEDGETARVTDFFGAKEGGTELGSWFGSPAGLEAF